MKREAILLLGLKIGNVKIKIPMKYKISIIGSFGFGYTLRDGQTIKTIELYKILAESYGEETLKAVDTHDWVKSPLKLFMSVIHAARESECIIILPAHNAVKVIPRLVLAIKKINVKVYYSVIGGWLPDFLEGKPKLIASLKELDGIWVETNTMKKELIKTGFDNVVVVPNCKELNILKKDELVYPDLSQLKLCIFSRVNRMKGISDAVQAITEVNTEFGSTMYSLDIYGPISDDFKDEFERVCNNSSSYISYRGCIPPEQSVETIKNYFALLFPTLYPTEGVPGTIIDAYSAGVPVISAKWNSFIDIVDDGQTGIGYLQGDFQSLKMALINVANVPETLCEMKIQCLHKAENYSSNLVKEKVLELLTI